MSSFVSDGASMMTGETSVVAARIKNLQPFPISFHCTCHKLTYANRDADHALKPVKNEWQNFQHNLLMMRRMLPKVVKEGSCKKTPIDWILSRALCQCHTVFFLRC